MILAACGTTAFDGDDDQDAFRAAAVSWVGAPLEDMIAVWGKPSERIIEPAEGRSGLARWRDTHSFGNATQNVGGYRCIVEVRYGVDGTILRVDTISPDCDDRYGDVMDQLSRPGS
jgi:hypothetical protein